MQRCKQCNLPETHETISFNKKGVCNICENFLNKRTKIDWSLRKKELDDLIQQHRDKSDYDCIIPYSGGKDSTWTVYYLIKEYNIKPLIVRFDHGFFRPNLENNLKKMVRKLGVDVLTFTPNWKVVQKLMLTSFLEKGDFCWHCHTGIFAYPMQIAIEKKIPLIFWGEGAGEYDDYFAYHHRLEKDEKAFNREANLGISSEDMLIRLNGQVDERDLKPFTYPKLEKLRAINYKSVCLGTYIIWDVKKNVEVIKKELDWKGDEVESAPPGYNYEKIECYMQGVRDYIKYIKRGYSRASHLVSLDIRNKRISLNKAKELISLYEGKRPASLDIFLNLVGLTEEEFMEVAISHEISPWKFENNSIDNSKKTKDFDKWSKDGPLDRKISKPIIDNWKSNCANCKKIYE